MNRKKTPYKKRNIATNNQSQKKTNRNKQYNKAVTKTPPEGIRLNRFLANAGICSRREADKYIESGVVSINGKVVMELGIRVKPNDVVRFNDAVVVPEKKTYILLNKPKDYVTKVSDPHAKHTVMELIRGACDERIYPVGRLDRNTTGVLLFTNDGDLAKKLTHPKHLTKKIYHVFLDKPVTQEHIKEIAEGINLDDGMIAADAISYVEKTDKKQVGIEIHSGRNRIVRRIFEHLGYKVVKLDRVYFAGLTKKGLSRGKWRMLNAREISRLKAGFWK
jgi:23S rRNA pseudouridine2605 synthase